MIIAGYLLTYCYVFFVIGFANFLKKKLQLSQEFTRKFIHIFVSFIWVIMYCCFGKSWHLIIPPISFVVINYLAYKKDVFAMERKKKGEKNLGTVYYPISVLIMSFITALDGSFFPCYGIGLFCMALADGLASFCGHHIPSPKIDFWTSKKTVAGSISVIIISLLVILFFNNLFVLHFSCFEVVFIACAACILELIGIRGLDNLSLPLGVSLISYLCLIW